MRCSAMKYTALTINVTSCWEIVRRFNCYHSTITILVGRYDEANSVRDRPRSARPRATHIRQDRHVTLTHTRDRFVTDATTTVRIRHIHYIQLSVRTIRRRLRAARMTSRPPIVDYHWLLRRRQLRINCARTHVRWSRDMFCSQMNPDFVTIGLTCAFVSGDVWGAIRVMVRQGRW